MTESCIYSSAAKQSNHLPGVGRVVIAVTKDANFLATVNNLGVWHCIFTNAELRDVTDWKPLDSLRTGTIVNDIKVALMVDKPCVSSLN